MATVGLFERFAAVALRTPERVALIQGDDRVDFGSLHERASSVAAALTSRGVAEGDVIGLHFDRSPDQVAATLGCFAVGAAVLPLPTSYPAALVRRTVEFARPRLVLDVADLEVFAGAGSAALPQLAPDPDRLAFVLSSSGSTGRPKLIARSHRSFFHRLDWTAEHHPFGEGELGCQKAHATTTHAIYELFEPLLSGAPSLIVPDDEARDLELFWRTVQERGVTRLLLVPSALRASLGLPGFEAPAELRVLVLMGEHVTADLAGAAAEAFPGGTALYSIYGSTEASSALVTDLRGPRAAGGELPLGVPIRPEVRALVLDDRGEPVPVGGEGRLHLAGPHLFRGYHGDPDRTATVLGPAPDGGAPLYDTRDRVRVDARGHLVYLGRADDFVKIRGFPVVLSEVETALREAAQVEEAVALVDGPPERATLIAFVGSSTPGREPDPSRVLERVRRTVPPFMVPSALTLVDAWPRTPSGKIDRRALLERYRAASDRAAMDPEANDWSDDERAVAKAWSKVVGRHPRGRDEPFFEAGGTSLNVYELVGCLRQDLGERADGLTAMRVYAAPTVRGMAAFLSRLRTDGDPGVEPEIPLRVTLKAAAGPDRPPLFVIASAGGTLGAYERLVAEITTAREVIGLRDPYLWGGRDPAEGFDAWVDRYLDALVDRQPRGPYYLCAYSSAGAFGWELARRLVERGEAVAALVMVEPLGLARETDAFAGRAFQAIWQSRLRRARVRFEGRWAGAARLASRSNTATEVDVDLAADVEKALRDRRHVLYLSALLELNAGRAFTLDDRDLEGVPPEQLLDVLVRRVGEVTPDVDGAVIRRLAAQYELQVRTQHTYRLAPLDASVTLVEPRSPIAGLLSGVLRPYARELRVRTLPVGRATARVREITARFGALATHYRSMRDPVFVRALARELERVVG